MSSTPPTSSTSSPPTNNLYITPVTLSTAPDYQHIRHETFRPTINKILYEREPSAETQAKIIEKTKEDIEDGVMFMACMDRETGEMVAGARWRFVCAEEDKELDKKLEQREGENDDGKNGEGKTERKRKYRERTMDEVKKGLTLPTLYPESNVPAINALFSLFNTNKLELLGTRPYVVLDTLVTHPEHHRRGAGGMLVAWGCAEADKRGVEAYLEASIMGAPLYERFGFRAVKRVGVDLREFGGDEVIEFIVSGAFLALFALSSFSSLFMGGCAVGTRVERNYG